MFFFYFTAVALWMLAFRLSEVYPYTSMAVFMVGLGFLVVGGVMEDRR